MIGGVSGMTFRMQRIHTFVRPWSLQQASGAVEPLGSGTAIRLRAAMKAVNAILQVILGAVVLLAALAAALLFPKASSVAIDPLGSLAPGSASGMVD